MIFLLLIFSNLWLITRAIGNNNKLSGKEAYDSGVTLAQLGRDAEAAEAFWIAILRSSDYTTTPSSASTLTSSSSSSTSANSGFPTSPPSSLSSPTQIQPQQSQQQLQQLHQSLLEYDIRHTLEQFMATYHRRKIPEYGLLRLAKQFKLQGMEKEAIEYLNTVISMNSKIVEAYLLLSTMQTLEPNVRLQFIINALMIDPDGYHTNFEVASQLWDLRAWESSLSYFERSYQLNNSCHASLSTAIYLRQFIAKWGPHGSQYYADNQATIQLIQEELHMLEDASDVGAVTVHPHMALGYHIPPELKLQIARSHAASEKALVRQSIDLIFTHKPAFYREAMNLAQSSSGASRWRLKVGYVSANIKSKTTVYMAQDLFRFHNRERFEIHVYATTPGDSDYFLENAMGGVDWRAKIENTVEFFHDMSGQSIIALANQIRSDGIHILINWDGYSNNGVRPTGLFPMQTAPIQVAHQFIYLPHCFLANSMAYMAPHITPPRHSRPPGKEHDPKANGCGGEAAEFVYCNFNKHLKFSPDTFSGWLSVLEEVPGSVLCLLENPTDSTKHLLQFTEEYNATLLNRVRFQPLLANPFDNQRRGGDMCHIVLDTPVYNGHTTAVDALWAGVPIVVYGNGLEMAGRVGHSIMTTLGISELIAQSQEDFVSIATRLGNEPSFFRSVRSKLIHTAYQANPKNPFWDLESYVRNLEKGFEGIWNYFIHGKKLKSYHVISDRLTAVSKMYSQHGAEKLYLSPANHSTSFFQKDPSPALYEKKIPSLNRTAQKTLAELTSDLSDIQELLLEFERALLNSSSSISSSVPTAEANAKAKETGAVVGEERKSSIPESAERKRQELMKRHREIRARTMGEQQQGGGNEQPQSQGQGTGGAATQQQQHQKVVGGGGTGSGVAGMRSGFDEGTCSTTLQITITKGE